MSAFPPDAIFDADPLPVTVPFSLHEAMVKAVSVEFAVSYLCGAIVFQNVLHARTHVAKSRLKENTAAMLVLTDNGIVLGEPIPPEDRILIPAVERAKKANQKHTKW